MSVRAKLPFDRHGVERGFRPPPAVRNHGDAAADVTLAAELNGRMNAGAILDGFELVTLDRAAIDRTGLGGGVEHPGKLDVDPVDRLAGDLERHVEILLLRPNQGELA